MSSKIFLDPLLGSLQFFQSFPDSSKLLLIYLNQGLCLGNSYTSSGYNLLCVLSDDLRFSEVVNQSLIAGLKVIEVMGLLSHLLLYLFPLVFLSSEELIQFSRASSIGLAFSRILSSLKHIPNNLTSVRYTLTCSELPV